MNTEKVLEFAYGMRNFYENYLKNTENFKMPENSKDQRKMREALSYLYPEYKSIYDMIEECETEIAYNTAKSSGKNDEKRRTKAAKEFIKINVKKNKSNLQGYYKTLDGKIQMINDYMCYIGSPIIGISEVENPEKFPDCEKFIPRYLAGENVFDLDINGIKAKYKQAKTYAKTIYKDKADIEGCIRDVSTVIVRNDDATEKLFNVEYIIIACDMLGGENFTIQTGGKYQKYQPCIIKGENGICIITPFINENFKEHELQTIVEQ